MRQLGLILSLFAAIGATGCTSTKSSHTSRTGTEQLLISNAVDQSLDKVNFTPFAGRRVMVDEKYIDCVDKAYVLGSIRHRLLRQGSLIVTKPEDADVVMELRSGGVGTDASDAYLGMPEIVLPGMLTLPEVRLLTRSRQIGTAKIGLVAYDPRTQEVLGEGGVSLARSDDNNWFVFGVGPYQNGTLRTEVSRGTAMYPGQQIEEVPHQVAFRSPSPPAPPDSESEGRVRFTNQETSSDE